jgi:Cu(I)/Ag(I) efflux system membrane protein CusA/SilA
MLTSIIRAVIEHRVLVLAAVAALFGVSLHTVRMAPLDAVPDISDPQVVVYAKWPRSAELLDEDVVTPLARALLGMPGIESIRATSHLGYSFIYLVLDDAGNRDAVKRATLDRINEARARLPADADVRLGPDASSMGWIYQYALVDREQTHDLRELRAINESRIKPHLEKLGGIAEVASVGGLERQVQLKVFPPLLASYGLPLVTVVSALQEAFEQVGGRMVEVANRDYQVRGEIKSEDIDSLENLVVGRATDGRTIRLKEIGFLQVGYDLRRGIADLDGEGEVVGGIVIMEQGRNVIRVARELTAALDAAQATLPSGIEIVTAYDRSALIWSTIDNFVTALAYELGVVIVVIVVALRSARAAIAPVAVLLLSCLFTVLPLAAFGQTINLLSLAGLAIAVGEMADATIVIVENCTAELAKRRTVSAGERLEIIIRAIARMTRPLLFSLAIILASFLPIFFLGEREARLFDPLAFSKTFAMSFSTLLTLLVLPILIVWIFKHAVPAARPDRGSGWVRGYERLLRVTIRARYGVVALSAALLAVALVLGSTFQRDYMPELEEGSILYMPTTLPGMPGREAGWVLQQMDRKLKEIPEVERVFGKLGRADTATDPAPTTMVESTVLLKPRSEWRDGYDKERLLAELDNAMEIVGFVNAWTQPIAARISMQDTGIQTPVGIKVTGPDLDVIGRLATEIEAALRTLPGTKSVLAERVSAGSYIDVQYDLGRLADEGVTLEEATLTVRHALGGENAAVIEQADGTTVPLSVQYSPEYVDTLDKVRNLPVVTAGQGYVPLGTVAEVNVREMPEMIRNDNGQRAGYIFVDLDGVTGVDYVPAAQAVVAERVALPDGYALEWTGSHRYAAEARARLLVVVPATVLITVVLLWLAFRSWGETLLIILSAPFALVGGVLLQWFQGYPLTTAVIIGYIAVLAIAVQTGIIMIEFIRDALAERTAGEDYVDAVVRGSVARLRPKLMTVATTVLGLLPIMLASGSGLDVTQPIAAPSVGGMVSSTIYVLLLIPCLFAIGHDLRRKRARRSP